MIMELNERATTCLTPSAEEAMVDQKQLLLVTAIELGAHVRCPIDVAQPCAAEWTNELAELCNQPQWSKISHGQRKRLGALAAPGSADHAVIRDDMLAAHING